VVGGAGVVERLRRCDLAVVIPVVALMATGLCLIHSATADGEDLVLRQLRWFAIGTVLAAPLVLYPYTRILRFAPAVYLVGLGVLVELYQFGPTINQARRWFVIGGQQVQPSELMKLATVLLLARSLRFGRVLDQPRKWILPLVVAVLPAALIVVQPDLGTALLFAPLAFAVVLVSGIPLRSLLLLALLAGILVGGAYEFVLQDYQKERIWSTYNHDRLTASQRAGPGFQLNQSLQAISGGGLLGQGHREGTLTQAGLVPLDYNDFVFAVLAEEHGFSGCLLVLLLFCVLVLAIYRVAWHTRDPAGRLICVGIGTLLGAQALVHMAVTLGLAPTTGMTLPLVSYGGSSLLVTMMGLALVQNVAINRPRTPILEGL
jgi:rod shape determining protein RodA